MELVKKTNAAEVRIEPIEYDGQKRIDVRLWVTSSDGDKMVPPKREVGLRLDQVAAFRRDLTAAEAILRAA